MKLIAAFDEFSLQQRRLRRGEDGPTFRGALAALREFLMDYSGYVETEEVSPGDLFTFLLDYYPSEEEPDPDVALALLETAAAWALWLVERGGRHLAPFVAAEERLRADLPRVAQAYALLQAHTRRDDLAPPVELTDEEATPRGAVGAGVNRVARLNEVDYASSETEYWVVRRVDPAGLTVQTPQREVLSEPEIQPVLLPAGAAGMIAAGDIIHAEIAPGPAGWELLEVFGIRPGGY